MFLSYEQDVNLLEGMGEAELTDANKVYIYLSYNSVVFKPIHAMLVDLYRFH
jgi:hypothetical protein